VAGAAREAGAVRAGGATGVVLQHPESINCSVLQCVAVRYLTSNDSAASRVDQLAHTHKYINAQIHLFCSIQSRSIAAGKSFVLSSMSAVDKATLLYRYSKVTGTSVLET